MCPSLILCRERLLDDSKSVLAEIKGEDIDMCSMRDSREKGAGMRDQDPRPFQTLIFESEF